MCSPEQIYTWAEAAVEEEALKIDPGLGSDWSTVKPKDMGLDSDNWVEAAGRMVHGFNVRAQGLTSVSLSRPTREKYYKRDLIEYVGEIADAGKQVT